MKRLLIPVVFVAGMFALTSAEAQQPGVVGAPPPEDFFVTVITGENGQPVFDGESEFTLALGGYYRMNFVCPDATEDQAGFHFEVTDLLTLPPRVVSVGDIEIYMQGLYFHAIECDEAGAAKFSFHPMRRGVYDIYVRDHSDPAQEIFGRVIVE